jgi:hypothetical protein
MRPSVWVSCIWISATSTQHPSRIPHNLRKLHLTLLPGAATMTRHFFWLVVALDLTPIPVVGFEGAAWGLGVGGLLLPALLVCYQLVSNFNNSL